MGNLLNLRDKKGTLMKCCVCGQPATQLHFLNLCPLISEDRRALVALIPKESLIDYKLRPDLYGFFWNLRIFTLKLDNLALLDSTAESLITRAERLVAPISSQLISISDSILIKFQMRTSLRPTQTIERRRRPKVGYVDLIKYS